MGSKWTAEIAEHCQGVKLVLVALKCDLREEHEKDDDDGSGSHERHIIQYNEGLEMAKTIGALRYLGTTDRAMMLRSELILLMFTECSAMKNRGVNEAFTEAARVALSVKPAKSKKDSRCTVM